MEKFHQDGHLDTTGGRELLLIIEGDRLFGVKPPGSYAQRATERLRQIGYLFLDAHELTPCPSFDEMAGHPVTLTFLLEGGLL